MTYQLDDHLDQLRLPAEMAGRSAHVSPVVMHVVADLHRQIDEQERRFMPGLLIAFVAMAEATAEYLGEECVEDVLDAYERERVNDRGQQVNTLNLILDEQETIRLRRFYDAAEHVFIHALRRYDYPNSAPHATQAWPQHQDVLTAVFAMSREQRRAVADAVWERVLRLPEHRRRSSGDARPRPFELVLDEGLFPGTQKGEPRGAILQGLSFAYYRADSPNVTIETGKAGAGSKRTGRIGDVDGWSGPELVLSIEAKDAQLTDPEDPTLDSFIANLGEWPDATAIVVARGANDEVVDSLEEQNVAVITRRTMLDAVVRWDLNKQRLATREFYYYLARVERNGKLIARFDAFLCDNAIEL
jgi:hypothetical protein